MAPAQSPGIPSCSAPRGDAEVRVLCWRGDAPSRRFGILRGGPTSTDKSSAVGWEKDVQGKLGDNQSGMTD
ncbi:hypothetical protein BJV74DRAFT_870578 [Russula compacta]|nr:hypothetical protein BJV74DRAFT_870578 [Russula compacta]